jgi:hypothetical protein
MKFIIHITVVIILLSAIGCRSAKKLERAISNSKKDTARAVIVDSLREDSIRVVHGMLEKMTKNRIDFNTFSAHLKVNYTDAEGVDNEFKANLRIKKDSVIWLLIEATLLDVEAIRILITHDSVKILNKLDKTLTLRSMSFLQQQTKLPLDFAILQDLLIGNPVFVDSNIVSYQKEPTTTSLLFIGELVKNYLTVNNGDFSLKHSKLDYVDMMDARSCDLTYADYEHNFSTYRRITVESKSKLDIEFVFKQFKFNETLSFPFGNTKNYKQK